MDVDNEHFYDEIASFMPQPGDYSLDDLDEIIRSTDSHLAASLGLNVFTNTLNENDFDMMATTGQTGFEAIEKNNVEHQLQQQQELSHSQKQQQTILENGYNFNFSAFPSPSASNQSAGYSSPYETPARTSSTSSIDGDHLNPDDFINFLNNDDVKCEDLTHDTIMQLNEDCRNTPSPTGSCTSSSGSSTSGVQSDASSVASMTHDYNTRNGYTMTQQDHEKDLSEFIKFKNEKSDSDMKMNETHDYEMNETSLGQIFDNFIMPPTPASSLKDEQILATTNSNNLEPITLPVLPVALNIVQSTIIPVQTAPLTPAIPMVNTKTPTAIKIDPETTNSTKPHGPTMKVITNTSPTTSQSSTPSKASGSPKVSPPPNAKPKTIFLSSNDFKALMQKMNTNGTNGKKLLGSNGQMPKIIMKTASGKIISANKLPYSNTINTTSSSTVSTISSKTSATSSSNSQSLQIASKMLKASGSMLVKQQSSKVFTSNSHSAAAMAAARANLSHTKSCRTEMGIFKGLHHDDKILKKQLRMLKNRESASLSRKKKKEYVERLENRINNLEKENYVLKGENTSLRSQLMAFAQTCNCKHGNVSEFILSTLNMNGKHGGSVLNTMDAQFLMNNTNDRRLENGGRSSNANCTGTRTTHHVKIAPKPANNTSSINKGFKHRMNAATVKKNLAVLFAMAFMVTLNVGNFQTYLNKSALENAMETPGVGANEEPVVAAATGGRRLLWVPNEHEFQQQTNRSKRETDKASMPPPPLHFLRPVNRTTADKMNGTSAKDEPPIRMPTNLKYGTAAATTTYANATQENMRLARNLHKWIDGNDYLNITGPGTGNDIEQMAQFKFGSSAYMDYDLPLQAHVGTKQKRKIFLNTEIPDKQAKLNVEAPKHNSLDLFKPRISEEYLRLFKGIKRQDDTFYVLSFNMDHILLPASAYNKSLRPKMSLMLPAGDPSLNGDIVLMQIDCEVINTTELEIKSHMIPEKLRPSKYTPNVRVNPNDVANNETAGPASAEKSNEIPLKREELKEKPSAPRTYFMGPKNQAASSNSVAAGSGGVVKRKPTIVKFNANDSVIGSGVLNVRNSTLFSRMRETVGSQTNGIVAATDVKNLK